MNSAHETAASVEARSPEKRLLELKLELPPAPKPLGLYRPIATSGNLVFTSGHGPLRSDGTLITGKVGVTLDLDAGKAAARQVGLALLASLRAHLGDLDRIERVVKVVGFVNSANSFFDHPKVINGCSELFAEIWGTERGVGARSAVGVAALPSNMAVEIEAVFQLR